MKYARTIALVGGLCAAAHAQQTTRISVNSSGVQGNGISHSPAISADGRYVAFQSSATNLVPGDTNARTDIFVRDRHAGVTSRVSVDSSGGQAVSGHSEYPSISADGRYVAFESGAVNLVPGDTNASLDVFVHDRQTGVTSRVSVDASGGQVGIDSQDVSITPDGRYVVFESLSSLVAGDMPGFLDVYVRDLQTGVNSLVSVDSSGVQGNHNSGDASISDDGRYVTFEAFASNLVAGDTNAWHDIFVHDRQTGATTRVSVDSSGGQGDNFSRDPWISGDGRLVVYASYATNLVAGDTNGWLDVFLHDRQTAITLRVSVDSVGVEGNFDSQYATISADGRYVGMTSRATNLVFGGDINGPVDDVIVHDLLTGVSAFASIDSSGGQGGSASGLFPAISPGGSYVLFSTASPLVPGDTNGVSDVFMRDVFESGFAFCSPGEEGILACPCAPGTDLPHDPGHGCSNFGNPAGALLVGTGTPVTGADSLVLTATGLGNGLTIFMEGPSAGMGIAFGDGVRCVTGALKRFGATIAAHSAAYPDDGGDLPISGSTGALPGETKYYQAFYRAALDWCNAATFNTTSGYVIAWH